MEPDSKRIVREWNREIEERDPPPRRPARRRTVEDHRVGGAGGAVVRRAIRRAAACSSGRCGKPERAQLCASATALASPAAASQIASAEIVLQSGSSA